MSNYSVDRRRTLPTRGFLLLGFLVALLFLVSAGTAMGAPKMSQMAGTTSLAVC